MTKKLKFIANRAPTEKELKIMKIFESSLVEILKEQKENKNSKYPVVFGEAFHKAREILDRNKNEEPA